MSSVKGTPAYWKQFLYDVSSYIFSNSRNTSSSKKVHMRKPLQFKQTLRSTTFTTVLVVEGCYKSCYRCFNQIQTVIFVTYLKFIAKRLHIT